MRPSRRAPDELRAVSLERGVVKYAEGSCMVKFGDTHVLVTATLEERLPPWLKGQGRGWVTAEYGMLPRATSERTRREAAAGKQTGRTVKPVERRRHGVLIAAACTVFRLTGSDLRRCALHRDLLQESIAASTSVWPRPVPDQQRTSVVVNEISSSRESRYRVQHGCGLMLMPIAP